MFFFSSRRRHTRLQGDWSSDVCSSDLIREELRRTIRQVQRELGITTVLVTHDQEEAFAMADRIGVMNLGRLLEMGAPHDLYSRPATRFAATFLGAANLILARRTPDGIQMGANTVAASERSPEVDEREVVAVVRPEEVEVAASRDALSSGYLARGVVDEVVFTGDRKSTRLNSSHLVISYAVFCLTI